MNVSKLLYKIAAFKQRWWSFESDAPLTPAPRVRICWRKLVIAATAVALMVIIVPDTLLIIFLYALLGLLLCTFYLLPVFFVLSLIVHFIKHRKCATRNADSTEPHAR